MFIQVSTPTAFFRHCIHTICIIRIYVMQVAKYLAKITTLFLPCADVVNYYPSLHCTRHYKCERM